MGFAESDLIAQSMMAAFRSALLKLGWTESGDVRTSLRWAEGDLERYCCRESDNEKHLGILLVTLATAARALIEEGGPCLNSGIARRPDGLCLAS